ncbi:MAG: hypothetical protein HRF43_09175 [Phycisphaerae bacterium]|jgi:hypothetical protein
MLRRPFRAVPQARVFRRNFSGGGLCDGSARAIGPAGAALLLLAATLGCKPSASPEQDDEIKVRPLGEAPHAQRPRVLFPDDLHVEDDTVNQFISHALQTVEEGDYDRFRQIFGIHFPPPDEAQFRRVWRSVQEVAVARVFQERGKPNEYYVYVVVKLREPDRHDRTQRDVPVLIHQEEGRWRLGEVPAEMVRRIRAASSLPATAPAASSSGSP